MGEVAGWRGGIELRARCGRIRGEQPLPRRLAQRVVLGAGERRVFLGAHVTQVAGDVHDFVVAEHHVHGAAGGAGLGFEAHQQVEDLARLGAAVEQVAQAHEVRRPGTPVQRIVDDRGLAQHGDELRVRAVHVGEGHDAIHAGVTQRRIRPCRQAGDEQHQYQDQAAAHGGYHARGADWRNTGCPR